MQVLDASAEVVPQAEEDFAEVTQSTNEQAVVDVELVEATR